MPTLNATARNTAAGLLAGTYASGTLVIYAGATVLVTHNIAGFGAPSTGVVTANAIADATVAASGTATTAKMIAGANELTLTVGTSGAEVIMSTLSLVAGGTSTINSLTLTMPAS
jgi:hypothetical protein